MKKLFPTFSSKEPTESKYIFRIKVGRDFFRSQNVKPSYMFLLRGCQRIKIFNENTH